MVFVNNFIPQPTEYQAENLERLDAVKKPRWVKGWGNKRRRERRRVIYQICTRRIQELLVSEGRV